MQYYAISEIELKQFHMAAIVAGGGQEAVPVLNSIRERKIPYAAESQKPAHNTPMATALWKELKRRQSNGLVPLRVDWVAVTEKRLNAAVAALRHR